MIDIEGKQLRVRDSGIGISNEEVQQIFKPFYRAKRRQQRPRGGHGVGLTIVKMLSDRFHWPVTMTSEPNVGTQVIIRFPDATEKPVADSAESSGQASSSHGLHTS